jgi:hypothetical protein
MFGEGNNDLNEMEMIIGIGTETEVKHEGIRKIRKEQ